MRYDDRDMVWKRICDAGVFYIYGAQVVAYGVYTAIKEVINKKPRAFVVSSVDNNPASIEGIPVLEIDGNIDKEALIIVAVPEIYHNEIRQKLWDYNLHNLLFVDTHVEYLVMSRYFKERGYFLLLEDLPLAGKETGTSGVSIFMAKHHNDKPLKKKYDISPWIIPVQAGAALTDASVAELKDNAGDNISHKNYKYSELSVTYWAWKNRDDDYLGICHYRRMLLLNDDDIRRIKENGVNAVLPLPFVCHPDASGQYGRYISDEDQEKLFQALYEVYPEYYSAAKSILKQQYLYNYNMFLADRQTFNKYCEWMFPVLERAEKLCETKSAERTDRYLGYFGEVLTAVYFLYNKDNFKIAHAEKVWMV